ncbi:MAG: TIGR02757 family protein [Candidatus Hydrogenedentota bacterium]
MSFEHLRERLESLYWQYNDSRYIHPDPLEAVYWFTSPEDREVAGLMASSLAFGNVGQILRTLEGLFQKIGSPRDFVMLEPPNAMHRLLREFQHRYTNCDDLVPLLLGMRGALVQYGSLGACFADQLRPSDTDLLNAAERFATRLRSCDRRKKNYLLPDPAQGSACKRLHMYFRWMIRHDAVDPGVWQSVSPSLLLVPVDTHMHRIARALNITHRKSADGKTALEITQVFRTLAPEDPVRYDFALTRLGIRRDEESKQIAARFLSQ